MPVKIARSPPRPSFGLPEATAVVRGRQPVLPERGESTKILPKSGVIWGISV